MSACACMHLRVPVCTGVQKYFLTKRDFGPVSQEAAEGTESRGFRSFDLRFSIS